MKQVNKLTDILLKSLKPAAKRYKAFDGDGLFIDVTVAGGKIWRFRYRFARQDKTLTFGSYPTISLSEARAAKQEAQHNLTKKIDPGELKRLSNATPESSGKGTFQAVALAYIALKSPAWSAAYKEINATILQKDLFPWLGKRPIGEITPRELFIVLKRIDQRTAVTARKALSLCKGVFNHAIPSGLISHNPTTGLATHLTPHTSKQMAAPRTEAETARIMATIDEHQGGRFMTFCALKLAPLFFIRPGTLRGMEWEDVFFDKAEWRIPINQLKRKETEKIARGEEIGHIIPLCTQALTILRELYQLTGQGVYVFPGERNNGKCMCKNTMREALRRMGFTKEEITPHGFRHMASTRLHELNYPSHLIEKQLAHCDGNKIRAIYNYAEYLAERKKMMQEWADYLDTLKDQHRASVAPLLQEVA
jgi:integrase